MAQKTMLIDGAHPEEVRVVVMNDSKLEEFEFESAHKEINRGNIYVGEITRVEPSLQAAFISYGGNRNGFLAFSEVHPSYYNLPEDEKKALLEEFNQQDDASVEEDLQASSASIEDAPIPAADAEAVEPEKKGKKRPVRRSRKKDANLQSQTDDEGLTKARTAAMADATATGEALTAEEIEEDARALALANGAVTTTKAPEESSKPKRGRRPRKSAEKAETTPEAVQTEEAKTAPASTQRKRFVAVHRRYQMDKVLKPGQKVLIQINKEERGNKGAALTTYISLPGRFTVLMPNTPYAGGISRKITDLGDRRTLKKITSKLELPAGMGLIVRTAGMGQSEEKIMADVGHLVDCWKKIEKGWEKEDVNTLVHEDGSLIVRALRDMFTEEIDEVVVSGKKTLKQAKDYVKLMMPNKAKKVKEHKAAQPIFAHHGIEMELHMLDRTRVNLPSGGYLIINPTEALVSVDVNSGRATQEKNIEDTAVATNIEAAHELARQLRLRDLAGLIVVDFIDMEDNRNNRKVERTMREAMRLDRARSQVGVISDFGLLEMSRQRLHPSLGESNYHTCAHCQGKGLVRSPESAATIILRGLEEDNICSKADRIVITASTKVVVYMLNYKRDVISYLENTYKIRIVIQDDNKYIAPDHRLDLIRVSGDGTEKSQTIERSFREELDDTSNKKKRRKKRTRDASPEKKQTAKPAEKSNENKAEKPARGNNRRPSRKTGSKNTEASANKNTNKNAHTPVKEENTKKEAKPAPKAATQIAPTTEKPTPKETAKPVTKPLVVEKVGSTDAAAADDGKKKSVLQRWWSR